MAANTDAAGTSTAAPAAMAPSNPAPAATPAVDTPSGTAPTEVSAKDPKAVVCKRMAAETGTRLGSRMQCMTNAQWDDISRQSQDMIKMQTQKSATFADKPG